MQCCLCAGRGGILGNSCVSACLDAAFLVCENRTPACVAFTSFVHSVHYYILKVW